MLLHIEKILNTFEGLGKVGGNLGFGYFTLGVIILLSHFAALLKFLLRTANGEVESLL